MLDGCISRCLGDLLLFKELALWLQEGQGGLNTTDHRVQRAPIGIAREQIWQRLQTSRKDTDTSKQLNYYLLHLVALLQPSNGKVSFGNLRKSVPSNRSDWHKESGCTGEGTQWRLWGICQEPAGKDTYSLLTTVSFLLLFQFSFLLKCLLLTGNNGARNKSHSLKYFGFVFLYILQRETAWEAASCYPL